MDKKYDVSFFKKKNGNCQKIAVRRNKRNKILLGKSSYRSVTD